MDEILQNIENEESNTDDNSGVVNNDLSVVDEVKAPIDEKSLKDKIEYFSKKIEEQNEVQKKIIEQSAITNNNEEKNTATPEKQFVDYHQLSNELELLHQDIKICELYKKSLETEIKEYKSGITKINELQNRADDLKMEIVTYENERDLLKSGNITLREENEKLSKFNEQIKEDINKLLDSFKERERFINAAKSDIAVMKNEVSDLSKTKSKLLYDISNLKREVEEKTQKIESLNKERDTLHENIDIEIQKLKSEAETKIGS